MVRFLYLPLMPYKDPKKKKEYSDKFNKEYYQRNCERLRMQNRDRIYTKQLAVNELKESTPCMKCGLYWPSYVMDYHHRDRSTKIAGIAGMIKSNTIEKIMAEIEKCDLLCANCHRIKEHGPKIYLNGVRDN